MYKAPAKHKHHRSNDFDVYGDLAKIKTMLAKTTRDAKGLAGELFSDSLDEVKENSAFVQKNLRGYVLEKPLKALSITALLGIAVGYWLNRK